MKFRVPVIIIAAVLLSAAGAYAHHSFAGTYQEHQVIKLEGDVVEFNIRNPHSFILIEVTEKDGKKVKWGGEWGGVTQLSQGGVTRFTLEVGDHLIIDPALPEAFVAAMTAAGVSVQQIQGVLQANNLTLPSGQLTDGGELIEDSPGGGPVGTSMTLSDLKSRWTILKRG